MRIKILSLLVVLLSTWSGNVAFAQFYGSETVYCYKYIKTINDGISSKRDYADYIFINFQKDMMGIYKAGSDLKKIRTTLLENPSYYSEEAIKDLASSYNEWKSQPKPVNHALPPGYDKGQYAQIIKYNDKYSSTNKYTYTIIYKQRSTYHWIGAPGYPSQLIACEPYWGEPYWGAHCYTFSINKDEMIIWRTDDSENRDYYQLIDVNSLKPNMDFLE